MVIKGDNILAIVAVLFLASHVIQLTECKDATPISNIICGTPGIFCWCYVGYHGDINKQFDYKGLDDETNSYPNDTNGEDLCVSTCAMKCGPLFKDKTNICKKIENDYKSTLPQQVPIGCYSQIGEKPDSGKKWTLSKSPEDLCCKASKKGCEMDYGPGYFYAEEHNMCLKEIYDNGCVPKVPFNDKEPPVCCLTDPSTGQKKTYGCQPAHNCGFVEAC